MSTTGTDRETMTVMEAAKRLGVGKTKAYELFRSGAIPGLRNFGPRKNVVLKHVLEKYLEGEEKNENRG